MVSDSLTRSVLRQIEKQKVRKGGARIVTDDVAKLKGLASTPMLPEGSVTNYYVEPVTIEYYIPKESRFAYETKFLYIGLHDPEPKNDNQAMIFDRYVRNGLPVDPLTVMDHFPQFLLTILDHYNPRLGMYESLRGHLEIGITGCPDDVLTPQLRAYKNEIQEVQPDITGNPEDLRAVLYILEVLKKWEPSIPALEILGDFVTWDLNFVIRLMNRLQMPHTLEDSTTEYLIHRHRKIQEARGIRLDERFEILAQIYHEQAYPNADLDDEDEDQN